MVDILVGMIEPSHHGSRLERQQRVDGENEVPGDVLCVQVIAQVVMEHNHGQHLLQILLSEGCLLRNLLKIGILRLKEKPCCRQRLVRIIHQLINSRHLLYILSWLYNRLPIDLLFERRVHSVHNVVSKLVVVNLERSSSVANGDEESVIAHLVENILDVCVHVEESLSDPSLVGPFRLQGVVDDQQGVGFFVQEGAEVLHAFVYFLQVVVSGRKAKIPLELDIHKRNAQTSHFLILVSLLYLVQQ